MSSELMSPEGFVVYDAFNDQIIIAWKYYFTGTTVLENESGERFMYLGDLTKLKAWGPHYIGEFN